MNKCFLIGFLGKKGVELRYTQGNGKAVATYTLSVQRQYSKGEQKEYDYLNIVTWGDRAEWLANNQDKVKRLLVEGRITNRSYDKKDGSKAYITEIVSENVQVIEWNNEAAEKAPQQEPEEMTLVDDRDGIPF
jgi:single-strand DNA-binding protein